jgi:formylaminopyrimidine deformylase / aminopyrimidine aminohydrolase
MGEALTADALLTRQAGSWQAATVHPFLAGVRDGSVPADSFDRWLAPPSRTSACSPGAWSPPLGSSAGLRRWRPGAAWPSTPPCIQPLGRTATSCWHCPTPSTRRRSSRSGRSNARTWRAGKGTRPGAQPYREFVERWTTDGFRSYVSDLQAAVDRQLEASVGEQAREAEDASSG